MPRSKASKSRPPGRPKVTKQVIEESVMRELGENGAPTMSEPVAEKFALLLHVGCPPRLAVLAIKPDMLPEVAEVTAHQWMNDALVMRAMETRLGGKWVTLDPEKRYQLSRTKHLSEMAFFLWTNNFNDATKEVIVKMKEAREVISHALGESTGTEDPMREFMKLAIEISRQNIGSRETVIQRTAAGAKPADAVTIGFDKLLNAPNLGKA